MSEERYHYLNKRVSKTFPHRFLFIDTETSKPDNDIIQEHRMRLGISCYVKIGTNPNVIIQESWSFNNDQESICKYIDSLAYDKNPLWIVASNPKFDIGAMAFSKYFCQWGYELDFIAESGMVFILVIKKGKQKIKFVAIQNYLTTSIAKIGELLGKQKLHIDLFTPDLDLLCIYCFRDVEILMEGFLIYLRYVFNNDMGSFGYTKSAQAMNAYRYKFMSHFILIHKNAKATAIERKAYHGGRVEAFRIGKQKKQMYYQLDVNSMYSYIMRDNRFPYKLLGKLEKGNINQLRVLLKLRCICATVKIKTDKPVYPKRIDGKCCFPIGTFETSLTTPSLLYALEHDHIVELIDGYYYQAGKLFTEYVNYFWAQRMIYQKEKNKVLEEMVKLFQNSFYGKWGQMVPEEIDCKDVKEDKFDLLHEFYEKTGQYKIVRTLFHKQHTMLGKKEGKDSFVGIAAHVTDYVRMYLWRLIQEAGIKNVYYMDTDSLVIAQDTYDRVKGSWEGKELGKLKVEKQSTDFTIHGLKDYKLGDKVRRKGINKGSVIDSNNKVQVLTSYSLSKMMTLQKSDCAILAKVTKTIKREYTKGVITFDNRILPFELDE